MMLAMKCLFNKKYITQATLDACINRCLAQRSEQRQQLKQTGIDFDIAPPILYTSMKLSVFTELELITDETIIRQLCVECDEILTTNNLVLTYNRTFLGKYKFCFIRYIAEDTFNLIFVFFSCRCRLGYTILTLVRTHIWAYRKAGNQPRKPTDSASSPSKITDRLLYILQEPPNVVDFLIEAVTIFHKKNYKKRTNNTVIE